MNPAFLQFLSSAVLGELRIGISCAEVVSQMGPAVARSVTDKGGEIWKYGPLQLTIANDKLKALKLDCLERSSLPTPLQHVEVLPAETPLYAFIDMLDDHGIGWEIDPAYSFDRQLCIRTEGRVRAYFDLDHRELQSIQVFASE